jgi:hypothetical protein
VKVREEEPGQRLKAMHRDGLWAVKLKKEVGWKSEVIRADESVICSHTRPEIIVAR